MRLLGKIIVGFLAFFLAAPSDAEVKRILAPPPIDSTPLAYRTIREVQRVIQENFGPGECPTVDSGWLFRDGSIRAICSGGEIFRLAAPPLNGLPMRCSAVKEHGVAGC